eukprot:UN11216
MIRSNLRSIRTVKQDGIKRFGLCLTMGQADKLCYRQLSARQQLNWGIFKTCNGFVLQC